MLDNTRKKVIRRLTVPSTFLNLKVALTLVFIEISAGTLGFMLLEGYSLIQGLYMTVITISTVGYSEVKPLSESGHLFATLLILSNVGIFAYTLAVFSYYIVQGQIFKSFHHRLISSQIHKLEGHIIVCGYGRYGKEIVNYLQKHGQDFVVIDRDDESIQELQKKGGILYLQDDATRDEALITAGIERAAALVCA